MIKKNFSKLIDLKSFITIGMTIGMLLMLTGVFTPPEEVFALFSTSYGSVMTYYFTKRKTKEEVEEG